MSPGWSNAQFEVAPSEFIAEVIEKTASLLRTDLSPTWWDTQRWKFAHPFSTVDRLSLRASEADGLFFAGDALIGKG